MKILTLTFALLLTGCTTTPQQIVEQGVRYDAQLKLPPNNAADCIARNAENIHGDFITTVRPLKDDGSMEVILRLATAALAVTHVRPEGKGSAATSWWRMVPREAWPSRIVEGC